MRTRREPRLGAGVVLLRLQAGGELGVAGHADPGVYALSVVVGGVLGDSAPRAAVLRGEDGGTDQPLFTPLAMRSPMSLSTLRQYAKARSSTGSETPSLRCPTTFDTRRVRASSSMTSRTSVPA